MFNNYCMQKKIKLLLLADGSSIHTQRWANSLSKKGVEIVVFSLCEPDGLYNKEIKIYTHGFDPKRTNKSSNVFSKLVYLKTIFDLRRVISIFQPDILHAHYASSYGLLGALTGFHPYIISVWGSDVYDFPRKSFLHRIVLRYNLSKADSVLSTSNIMAKEISKYSRKQIQVTPFGVNLNLFKKNIIIKPKEEFIVGTVKSLSTVYRIDLLISAFKLVIDTNKNTNLKLQIVGDGPDKDKLILLTKNLGIDRYVEFIGKIENNLLPNYYNNFSIFVALSDSESFGVVAIEAMACGCPVIVSNADGFTEVVVDNETGYIVPNVDTKVVANTIQKFIDNNTLRDIMGRKGRIRVEHLYDWEKNVETMIMIYNTMM